MKQKFSFVLRFGQRQRVWRLPNERYIPICCKATIKHDKKINIWGCFSWNGVGNLYRVKGILEQKQYRQILYKHAIPSGRRLHPHGIFVFQQDNDPKHTAKKTKAWERKQR